MKKSLLLILGAAMLFAGCAKDLTSDLDNLTTYIPASIHNEAMLSGAWTSIAQ